MAWRSSGATNKDLVENMWRHGLIKDQRVKDAFLKVDRAHYAPAAPYEDSPQSIGHKATISAPHMHASATESLLPHILPSETRPAPRVLDVGSGSGYLTHLLAELVGDRGLVVGLEHIQALKDMGETNMAKSAEGRALLDSGKVKFRVGDGRKGWVEAPRGGETRDSTGWDAIHVGAAAVELHQELVDQLRAPGRMFIPVEDDNGYDQYVWAIDKKEDGSVVKEKLFGPLGNFVIYEGDNAPDFAILSHTWEAEEVTLQDVHDAQKDITLMAGYPKITGACRLAQSQGYDYIWIDTCCIDKTSSAELSEAINSMFNWYEQASICYVYLSDLDYSIYQQPGMTAPLELALRECRWFTRGWTLQELIAPDNVDFYDKSWHLVGSKLDESLGPALANVTGISLDILNKTVPLESSSVAERMHWASSRVTTRKEDLAYSLMGIFGVNMPLLYGEGMKAFARLQEAILQDTGDHSIFAWHSNYETSTQEAAFDQHILSGLLAPSPVEFSQFQYLRPLPAFGTTGQQPIQLTNQGIRISMYLEPVDDDQGGDDGSAADDFYAVLDCAIQGENGDQCPRIMLRKLSGNQYARVRTGSVCTVIPAPDSTRPGRGSYKTVFVKRSPTYVLPDISVLKAGWKAGGAREAYRVVDSYPTGPWVPSLGILRTGNPYFEPVLAGLRFESPTNARIQVDVVVGWRRVDGEWKVWCHACEAQADLEVDVLWGDTQFAVSGGLDQFVETDLEVKVQVEGDVARNWRSRGFAQVKRHEVPVRVRLVEVDRLGRKGVRIECCAPLQPHIPGYQKTGLLPWDEYD
ncbi:protein-L-isoaspartate O-methyltransferase [Colletotrichum tamarilloi]|uniref:Protein-L-isoaspartate O-methyltransferase n=1 Tax=Colletotrichum tamarilloi TaxID=1209934 RepID=A0ABQ9R5J4_9PEZI|nr:protein-L-isoaspartate O-methyltransferase [Colletotrichum tamarilloi]KAK1495259.1 protein-L-isoaspartate O-methyltransferase [Colletotrichum tamarilloi]